MNNIKFLLLISFLLISCSKKKDDSEIQGEEYKIHINVDIPYTDSEYAQLILTEPDDKIVLDTFISFSEMHELNYSSTSKLINLNYFYLKEGKLYANTYVEVFPDNWVIGDYNFIGDREYLSGETYESTIHYYNLPVGNWDPSMLEFMSNMGQSYTFEFDYESLNVTYYSNQVLNYTYLANYNLGLYDIRKVDTTYAEIDLINMYELKNIDITVNLDYPVSLIWAQIIAYPETYEYLNGLIVYDKNRTPFYQNTYITYPPEHMDTYYTVLSWIDEDHVNYGFECITDSVPSFINLIDKNTIDVESISFSDFRVNFSQQLLTYYNISWENDHFLWTLNLPPEINEYQPEVYLNSLNSDILDDIDLSNLNYNGIRVMEVDDFEYLDCLNSLFNPDPLKSNMIRTYSSILIFE